jgi:hypothetical protein
MGNLGFPGPFCEDVLGTPIIDQTDLANCIATLTKGAASAAVEGIFGNVAAGPTPDGPTLQCLAKTSARTRRLIRVIHANVTKCRNAILRGAVVGNPDRCITENETTVNAVAAALQRLRALVLSRCTDSHVLQLDLCGAGVGGVATAFDASVCLTDLALEIADAKAPPVMRQHIAASLIDASFPPEPMCGDGKINQPANPFLLLGEECDGGDDAACPGECLPPGTAFECSCGNVPRLRYVAIEGASDLDHGWTGIAHDTLLPAGAGFTMQLSNCDCTENDGVECTGTSTDPVCSVFGAHAPRCSWNNGGVLTCDQHGNANGVHEDRDCYVCDEYSTNAGSLCDDSSGCIGRCYDESGTPQGTCPTGQADCAAGEVCRGRCDSTKSCVHLPTTPPAPVVSGGVAICITQESAADLSGTLNIVTGEHSMNQKTSVKVYQGVNNSVPCPVCGGVCMGGIFEGEVCRGRCSDSGASCRFDDECPVGQWCTSESADCVDGFCDLALVCHGGKNDGDPCRIESTTELFGTLSGDCQPSPTSNISGQGLEIDYVPFTSELVSLPSGGPCSAAGFELFDCPCPDDGGRATRPNPCRPACDAGSRFGIGCGDGGGFSGRFTKCESGPNVGSACDEDTDCPLSTCSDNPEHCFGDPAFDRVPCSSDAECGTGSCGDACPAGRCVPLCEPTPTDPEDGICAAGPIVYHCNGTLDVFRACSIIEAEGSCAAQCSISGTPCDGNSDCPSGQTCNGPCQLAQLCEAGLDGILGTLDDIVGAGICVPDLPTCLPNPIEAEGGDTLNGKGSPNEPTSASVFCIGRTNSIGVDTVVGLGGPGRVRRSGIHVTSGFTSLP